MRILMASHAYPPTISGVTLVVQKLARAMVQRGHSVTVVAGTDREEAYRDEDRGVRVIRVRGMANPWWKETVIPTITHKDLSDIADEVQPDVLHAHEMAFLAMSFLRLKRERHLPGLVTCYYVPRFAARYLSWGSTPRSTIESLVLSLSVWGFNQADHVVFNTAAHRDIFLEQGLDSPASVISNGIDMTRYCPEGGPAEVESHYRLPPRPRILFVSRLAKDKEIDILLKAMPLICQGHEAHLLLVGRGSERKRLEALASELGMGSYVHFLGFVPEEDMPSLYRATDLFAITSLYEVQSLPTLQAVATGLPVVAANAVALPELVHDGVNGYLVPASDPPATAQAVLRLLDDPAAARHMGQAGLSIAAGHAEPHTFDQYEELYRRLIAEAHL